MAIRSMEISFIYFLVVVREPFVFLSEFVDHILSNSDIFETFEQCDFGPVSFFYLTE